MDRLTDLALAYPAVRGGGGVVAIGEPRAADGEGGFRAGLRRHGGRRNHLDIERHLPALGEVHLRWRIAETRPLQHEAVIGAVHHLVALLHIDREAADIGHEDPRLARHIGAQVPGMPGLRQQRRICCGVHLLDPAVHRGARPGRRHAVQASQVGELLGVVVAALAFFVLAATTGNHDNRVSDPNPSRVTG